MVWLKTTPFAKYRNSYLFMIFILSASLFAGQFLPLPVFKLISGYWMSIFAYSLVLLPLVNLFVFLTKKKGIFWIGTGCVTFFVFVLLYGSFNAWSPVVRSYDIELDKKTIQKDIKIVMVSDLHLGSIVGKNHLERLVKLTENEKPDLILIAGDIIDDHIDPYIEKNMDEIFAKINAPLGVYAVLGNHDYYGNDKTKLISEMDKIGIRVLMDEYLKINDQFYIAGRKEHTDETRKKANDFLRGINPAKPLIMMDHQPRDLDEAEVNGVDILLSGHTHRGQLAPANLITDQIYENDWGYLKKKNLHSIVSSGFGTWGPPLRIGTRSEVLVINVKGERK